MIDADLSDQDVMIQAGTWIDILDDRLEEIVDILDVLRNPREDLAGQDAMMHAAIASAYGELRTWSQWLVLAYEADEPRGVRLAMGEAAAALVVVAEAVSGDWDVLELA